MVVGSGCVTGEHQTEQGGLVAGSGCGTGELCQKSKVMMSPVLVSTKICLK